MTTIQQLVIALVISVLATTNAFAMEKNSIYEECVHLKGKTYFQLIDEAAKAKLPNQDQYARFIDFVRAFPGTAPARTILPDEGDRKYFQSPLDQSFFKKMHNQVNGYEFSNHIALTEKGQEWKARGQTPGRIASFELDYALSIVWSISNKLLGSGT